MVRSSHHKAPCYVVFSTPPITSSLLAQIFPNTLGYVPPYMWKTKFHTHKKQQTELYFCLL